MRESFDPKFYFYRHEKRPLSGSDFPELSGSFASEKEPSFYTQVNSKIGFGLA